MERVTEVKHPALLHILTEIRCRETDSGRFRALLRRAGLLLAYEAVRQVPTFKRTIETPLQGMEAPTIALENLLFISVLRAGNGLLEGALQLFPEVRVGQIGLARDEKTLQPSEYYWKVPVGALGRRTYLFDPMLATGHSASAALRRVKGLGPKELTLISLLAAPEGISHLAAEHPDVSVVVAAIDSHLNEKGYILPGLGDAGDRMFGPVD